MNRFTLFLTKKYLRSIKATYICITKVSLPNRLDVEVIKYSSENDYRLGQATITRAIIVHEKCFSNLELLQYVTAHEYGHKKAWYSFIAALIIVVLWLWSLFTLLYGLLLFQIGSVIFGLILLLVGCLLSWFIEYKADSVAIEILGINQVISARKQILSMPLPPLYWRIISRMTHLPFSWNLAIYRYLHKGRIKH